MTHCINCHKTTSDLRQGRCKTCYEYRRANGYDRPRHLIRTVTRRCECGAVATVDMPLNCNGQSIIYHLCDACAALEREPVP